MAPLTRAARQTIAAAIVNESRGPALALVPAVERESWYAQDANVVLRGRDVVVHGACSVSLDRVAWLEDENGERLEWLLDAAEEDACHDALRARWEQRDEPLGEREDFDA